MKVLLAVVEKNEDGLKISRSAGMEDLLEYHPKCDTCGMTKGIHGQEGLVNVFCQQWNRPVGKTDYCSNHTNKL